MSTAMPPPPTQDAGTPVSGPGSGSTGDRVKQFLVNLTGGGMPGVQKQLEDAHAKRVADAELYHKNYSDLSQLIAGDKTGKYVDAQGNLTPEGQKIEQQRQTAFQTWQKTAGVTKEGKSIIGKLGQFTDRLVHHRKDAGASGQPSSAMPGPPQAAASSATGATTSTSGMPSPPATPTAPAMPMSPGYTPPGQDPATLLRMQQEDNANASKLNLYKKEAQADADIKGGDPKRMIDGLVSAGFTQEEAKKIVQEKLSGAAGRPKSVMYSDPTDPTKKLFGTEVGGVVYDQQGDLVANAFQVVPAMLPTSRTGEMPVFNPVTNQFEQQPTHSSSQKVVPKADKPALPAPSAASKAAGPSSISTSVPTDSGRHGIPARQFNILQKQATSIDEARNSIIGDDPDKIGGLASDIDVFKRPVSVKRLSEYLGLVTSTVENEAKSVAGQGPLAATEWYLQLPQTVVGLQQGALADASRGLDDGAPDGPEHRFVADYFRTLGTIGGLRASTGASAAQWSFNTLRSELPTPGPVTSYPEALRRVKNIVQETNVVAKRNPLSAKIDPSRLDNLDKAPPVKPSGATHTGIGSVDKKKHWLDATGKDLGLAE